MVAASRIRRIVLFAESSTALSTIAICMLPLHKKLSNNWN
jgi:hypothetical protein